MRKKKNYRCRLCAIWPVPGAAVAAAAAAAATRFHLDARPRVSVHLPARCEQHRYHLQSATQADERPDLESVFLPCRTTSDGCSRGDPWRRDRPASVGTDLSEAFQENSFIFLPFFFFFLRGVPRNQGSRGALRKKKKKNNSGRPSLQDFGSSIQRPICRQSAANQPRRLWSLLIMLKA